MKIILEVKTNSEHGKPETAAHNTYTALLAWCTANHLEVEVLSVQVAGWVFSRMGEAERVECEAGAIGAK